MDWSQERHEYAAQKTLETLGVIGVALVILGAGWIAYEVNKRLTRKWAQTDEIMHRLEALESQATQQEQNPQPQEPE